MSKCDQNLELVSGEDLAEIDRSQREIAVRFEKSNEMLENCNAIMELSFVNEAVFNNTTWCESKYTQTHMHTEMNGAKWQQSSMNNIVSTFTHS